MTVISVIVTTYNRAACLLTALNSISSQTYTDYELLIVDDGSTDETLKILQQDEWLDNGRTFPKIKVISLIENYGVAVARNTGIANATGKLIAFLDSDDEWRSDYLKVMAQALEEHPKAILAYSHYQSSSPETNQQQEVKTFPHHGDLIEQMLLNNFIHTMSSVVVRKNLFEQVGLFNRSLLNASDREFYLRALKVGEPVVVPHVLVRKYWQSDSLTVINNSQQWLENGLKLLDIFYSQEDNAKYLPLKKKAEESLYSRVRSSMQYFRHGQLRRRSNPLSRIDEDTPAKVSLIVTCFNRSKYLAQTINSILNQTYSNFELLIWDDASTDNSVEIAKKYQQFDSRIKVVEQKINQGFTKSIASAIASTKGEYLGWVDSDDLLHPEALTTTVNLLDTQSCVGMVYTDRLIIDELNNNLGLDPRSSVPYSVNNLLLNFMAFHFRLIRRDVYELAGGIDTDFTTAQDYDLCLRISEIAEIEHIKQPLYFYRQHSNSISSSREFEQIACTRTAINNALVRRGLSPSVELKLRLKPKFTLRPQICNRGSVKKTSFFSTIELSQNYELKERSDFDVIESNDLKLVSNCSTLISLIITVYNREQYLAATIDSILAQTFADFELIIWDDGSTDRSLAIATNYAKQDSRIKVFSASNEGQGKALVKAIAQTNCKYLCTVDSDDLLHSEALSKTVSILEADFNVGMVYTDHLIIDAEGKEKGLGTRCSIPYSKERLLIDFMTFHFRLMRRDVYDALGGFDSSLSSAEDYDLCLRFSEVTQIEHLSEPLYYYRWHDNNLSNTRQLTQVEYSALAVNRALQRRGLSQKLRLEVQLNPRYRLQRQTKVANKVFGIGLSKTGTSSLNNALCLLGIPSIHFPRTIEQVGKFDGATDISIAIAYKELDSLYPGSKFILTIREPFSWLRSYQAHKQKVMTECNGRIAQWIKQLSIQLYGQWECDPTLCLSAYNRHLNSVMEHFRCRESDLLILNICDGQGWQELCPFLGCDVPNLTFPHDNKKSVFSLLK